MLDNQLYPAFQQNNVPVVIASNNLFAPYVGVFIRSLLDYASERNNYDIIILERDISKENKRLLKSLVAGYANVSVRFHNPSPLFAAFNYVDEEHPWPIEVFYRIVAPHILNYPGRIITVGGDMLLKTDIARLMDEDLAGCCVGGISNAPVIYVHCLADRTYYPHGNIKARDYYLKRNLYDEPEGWKNWENYKNNINGELLLFDCDKYVQELDVETILNTAQQSSHLCTEEDILYILLKEKIKIINLAWNVMPPFSMENVEKDNILLKIHNAIYNDDEAFQRSRENPYLLHYGGKPKPWVCPDVSCGSEWWQTALRTPFVGHIIARLADEQYKRRQYYKKKYGKEDVDIWEPLPKGIDRTKR